MVIDNIGVDVPLTPLWLKKDGELEVPTDAEDVGYWQSRLRVGPTVIVGHVDSRTGPAVFFRLGQLSKGDHITVHFDGVDGNMTRAFEVRNLQRVPKTRFPSSQVYRGSADELRLVTCGGNFDRQTGHYRDNVIVYATRIPVLYRRL